jgi:hypothetical protein
MWHHGTGWQLQVLERVHDIVCEVIQALAGIRDT